MNEQAVEGRISWCYPAVHVRLQWAPADLPGRGRPPAPYRWTGSDGQVGRLGVVQLRADARPLPSPSRTPTGREMWAAGIQVTGGRSRDSSLNTTGFVGAKPRSPRGLPLTPSLSPQEGRGRRVCPSPGQVRKPRLSCLSLAPGGERVAEGQVRGSGRWR
jgi:hypothetical protein